jgi:hypothetical protein
VLEAVLPPHHDRADLSADPIYFNHPSAREDLQHPLLLRPAAQGLNSVVIENYYVTGVHSNNSQNQASFYIYIYLPTDYDHTTGLIDVLTLQLDSMGQAGYPTSPLGLREAQVTATLGDIPTSEPDDDPLDTMTLITPPQLSPYPSKFRLALPTNSPASVGLLLLSSRQAPWTTLIPDAHIPPNIPADLCTRLSQQIPTITRTTNTPPKAARDMCTIYSPAFAGLTPTECLRHLRASILHTLNQLLTAVEYRQPHDTATMAAHLSPPTQALLQIIDTIQPATFWRAGQQPNSVTFFPSEIDYNPLRLQAQPYTLILQHPTNPTIPEFYSIRPPKLRTNAKGDYAWAAWWRTAIFVQCDLPLPIPTMAEHANDMPTGYLQRALLDGLTASLTFLTSIQRTNDNFSLATPNLRPAPDGSYIIPHQKRNTTTNTTQYVISLDDPYAYAMLATFEGPIRIQLHTLINIRGTNHSQVVYIQINPHTRSILGRTYHQLFLTPGTQELAPHITLPTYNPTKGITGRRYDKLMWATVLLSNVDTLEVFEEAIRQAGEQQHEETPAGQDMEAEGTAAGSSRWPDVQPPTNTGNANRRGGGRGHQPRPTKTQDKDKEQRKKEHNERWEAAAANRRAEGAAREAARQAAAEAAQNLANAGTSHTLEAPPPATLPIPPSNTADPTVDPTLADPIVDEENDIFHEPSQGGDDEHPEEELDLNSQDGSNQSKTISGVKELKENQPEDDATSAKKARTGKTIETPLNE